MSLWDWLPFYAQLKFGGLMACALCAAFLGGVAMLLGGAFARAKVGFYRAFALSLFFSSALWVLPYALVKSSLRMPPSFVGAVSALIVLCCFFIIKWLTEFKWKDAALVCILYACSQIILLLAVDIYIS